MTKLSPTSPPAEVQAAWADRLESNPERADTGRLAPTRVTRCCLGELCDMAVEAGVIDAYLDRHLDLTQYPDVREWAGLQTADGEFYSPLLRARSLVTLNDDGNPWTEIAEVIREKPEGLFR